MRLISYCSICFDLMVASRRTNAPTPSSTKARDWQGGGTMEGRGLGRAAVSKQQEPEQSSSNDGGSGAW
jgi:hypothetical protein